MTESRVHIAENGRITVEDPNYEVDAPLRLPASNVLEHEDGMPWFPGIGKKRNKDKILFVASCPLEEELSTMFTTKRQLLSGGPGNLFRRTALKAGIDLDQHNYTTLCKYPLTRKKKLKPSAADIQRCKHLLEDEIDKLQPRIVVCLGKVVFDYFFNLRLKEKEIKGGWFRPKDRNFSLFMMDPLTLIFSKPEALEAFTYDLKELEAEYKYGNTTENEIVQEYTLIEDPESLQEWIGDMRAGNYSKFSVDCEWAGTDYLSGRLRSVQFCWEKGKGVMIQFFNEHGEVATNLLETAQSALASFMNEPQIRFIGHNFSADAPWLEHHLKINTYRKCVFDTMYAMQTVDESYDQKLERLSIRFTTLGRYDIDLILWKKENGDKMTDGGYGAIPTEILFPYSVADVDVPMRAMDKLMRLLAEDDTLLYYFNLCLPYVTDGFTHMHMTGVPLDREDTRTVRKNFQMVASLMLHQFKQTVREKANNALLDVLLKVFADDTPKAVQLYQEAVKTVSIEGIKSAIGAKAFAEHHGVLAHWVDAQDFNPNSSDQKQRWLFGFKGLEPIKSTKADGMPSVDWGKVKALTPAEQRNYKPAVDKDVLQIYGVQDDDVKLLLEYLAVYQVIKNFLKTEGQGLEGFIREDGRVHTSFLMAETNRPRSLAPNLLNIPAYLQDRVKNGFKRALSMLCKTYNTDDPDEAYRCFLEEQNDEERAELPDKLADPVPLRWCFKAPPGWCFIDADYATAEVFALAYLSGDEELIAALTQPDLQFVLVQPPDAKEPTPVRVAFVEGVTQFAKEEWDEALLHNLDDLEHVLYNEDGTPQRPLRDVHWEMAENVQALNKPREKLRKALHRNGLGKVGNFCIAENQKVLTHKGPVNIQEITLDHLVWDGIEFVQHEGLTYNGYKKTISHYGLRGTSNHNVYDETGTCKRFGEIAAQQDKLFRAKRPGFKTLIRAFRNTPGNSASARSKIIAICRSYMQILWFDLTERFKKSRERLLFKVPMPVGATKVQKPRNCKPFRKALRRNDPTLLQKFTRVFSQLLRTWDRSTIQVKKRFYRLGDVFLAKRNLCRKRFRSYRQRRTLRNQQLTSCRAYRKLTKHTLNGRCHKYRTRARFSKSTSTRYLHRAHSSWKATIWDVLGRIISPSRQQPASNRPTQEKVYDIINAGPHHRYTVNGYLVSNSTPYGASPPLLERMVEVNTGEKPEPGTGERIIEAYRSTKPQAWEYLEWLRSLPETTGFYQAPCGAKRHFHIHSKEDVGNWKYKSILAGISREAANCAFQGLVAHTLARAIIWLIARFKEEGLKAGVCIPLYDALYICCPIEERERVIQLMKECMSEKNTWLLNGRELKFNLDFAVTKRWSCPPTSEELKELSA